MSSEEHVIIEEEVKEDGELKAGQNNFSKKFGNALRRSKRLMSGRKRQQSKNESLDKENVAPDSTIQESETTDAPRIEITESNGDVDKPKQRKVSQTFFSTEKQIEIDGKKIKEVEVTGEKSPEPIDMKKQKKLVRKKSLDHAELNVPCRDLGRADHEGWLLKKSGGHGLVPVGWKRYWCVVKVQKIYCYKTSFDIAADYAIAIQNYTVENATEKKKIAFRLKPKNEDSKLAVFAGESEDEVNNWMETLNKVLSGVDISHKDDNEIPEYEDRKRMYSSATKPEDHPGRKRQSSAFPTETETTGMPAGFGTRTSSTSQPRVRKTSAGGAPPVSCLAIGSMFKPLEEPTDGETPTKEDVQLKDLLYKEVTVTPSDTPETDRKKQEDLDKLNAEIEKLNTDMLVLDKNGERKDGSETTPEPVRKASIPTSEVEEPVTVDVKREEKDLVAEDSVQLEVKDDSGDKKTTSQLFNDLEIKANETPSESQAEVKAEETNEPVLNVTASVDEKKPIELSVDESPVAKTSEAPKNVEITTEVIITEVKEENDGPVDGAPVTRESTEIDAETVITRLEEEKKKEEPKQDEEEASVETSERKEESSKEENKNEEVLESTVVTSESVSAVEQTVDSIVQEVSSSKDDNKSVVRDVTEPETQNKESLEVVSSESVKISESVNESSSGVEETKDVTVVVGTKEVTNNAEETSINTKEPVAIADEAAKDAEDGTKGSEDTTTTIEQVIVDTDEVAKAVEEGEVKAEEEKEELVAATKKVETEVTTPEVVEASANEGKNEVVAPLATKEEDDDDNVTQEDVTIVTETSANDSSERTVTESASAEIVVVNPVTNSGDINAELSTEEKKKSVDLGEDLDIPSLDMGDSSLTDEINIELNISKSSNTTENATTQPNGHIAEV